MSGVRIRFSGWGEAVNVLVHGSFLRVTDVINPEMQLCSPSDGVCCECMSYLRKTSALLLQEVVLLELVVAVELMPGLQEFKPAGETPRRTVDPLSLTIGCFTHLLTYRGSFFARTLASNFRPFLATYSASLSMTAWMSGGGGIMAATCGGI